MLAGGMRGDSIRVLRFCDFYLRVYSAIGEEGGQGATALCWVQDEGKTNQVRDYRAPCQRSYSSGGRGHHLGCECIRDFAYRF